MNRLAQRALTYATVVILAILAGLLIAYLSGWEITGETVEAFLVGAFMGIAISEVISWTIDRLMKKGT